MLNDEAQSLKPSAWPNLSFGEVAFSALADKKQQRAGPIGTGGVKNEQHSKKLYQMRVCVHWGRAQLIESILDDKEISEDTRNDLQARALALMWRFPRRPPGTECTPDLHRCRCCPTSLPNILPIGMPQRLRLPLCIRSARCKWQSR